MNIQDMVNKGTGLTKILVAGMDKAKVIDFLAPLALRLYLVPVFWMAGSKKFLNFTSTADWFSSAEGLGLPAPYLFVFLVAFIEVLGAILLLIGFGVRFISIPLMITMAFAGFLVHWKNGWLAIASSSGIFATDRTIAAAERLEQARNLLQQNGNYEWLTEKGSLVILNNGIEFAATYFIMLLALFFIGGGRFVSLDYWLKGKLSS